jgi:two-component system cell cycle response regulator
MDRRVIIIEDNETNLELMVYLLEEHGYAPLVARNGEEGLAIIQRDLPDLALCDIQMPKLNGYELARLVKANPKTRPVAMVAVSALAMVGDREKGLASGFDGYISKPLDPKTFVREVEKFFSQVKFAPGLAPRELPIGQKKKGIILAVDDLAANNKLMESLLGPFGYEVISASGMTEAMQLARQHQPTLIVSDVRMHEGTGFELCAAVKTDARLKKIPVVLITSTYCDESARAHGLALGAARYIFRPIESQTLLAEIENCLAEKKQ